MTIGIVGGSGLYQMAGLEGAQEVVQSTPFGDPSDAYLKGTIAGRPVVFLARHGRGHRVPPDAINYRANIYGFKAMGVRHLISVSAVGSMREEIEPGHMVLCDQFVDRTRCRASSFFGAGLVAHVGFAEPVCANLRGHLLATARALDLPCHPSGTYVCMNGPQFSTRAESLIYRSWGVHVIGMTNLPEAKLAREAEIAYATIAMATDYDCWHEEEEDVSVAGVLETLKKNVHNAGRLIAAAIRTFPTKLPSAAWTALEGAIMTAPEAMDPTLRADLDLLVGRYLEDGA